MSDHEADVVIAYGADKANLTSRTDHINLVTKEPREIPLDRLGADTQYYYELREGSSGKAVAQGSFHTQRPAGKIFTFTVTADSHLDTNTDLGLYQQTLTNAAGDSPDFHIDLGDTFMTEKHTTRESALSQYVGQRFFFNRLAQSVPMFLTVGNHDGETPLVHGGQMQDLAVWANTTRKSYFPNPLPDGFYSGDVQRDAHAGLLEDYYAWQWGDAEFIVLSPYWYSVNNRNDESWGLTLGKTQYDWLKQTLETSKARFKFIFIHQLVGGKDNQGRGGVEAAAYGEWGGKNPDGSNGFKEHRPGWEMPIHQLLVRYGVTMVFHGHDHLFAKQDLDGIVYQEVPQPGDPRPGPPRSAEDYGYRSGVILASSGHMRMTVSPDGVRAEYVRSVLATTQRQDARNGEVAYAYTVPSREIAAPDATPQLTPSTPAASPQDRSPDAGNARQKRGNTGSGSNKKGQGRNRGENGIPLPADVAALERLSIILGRPTADSVTANILSADDGDGFIEYGPKAGNWLHKTNPIHLFPGVPVEATLGGLVSNNEWQYRFHFRKQGAEAFTVGEAHSFATQRAPDATFTFEIQGDSHPERPQQFDAALYAQTLEAAAADHPDFYMTIGDDFSVDALHTVNAETVAGRYKLQRPFLALVGKSAPIFLVNGNHEQAAAANLNGTANNVAVWAQTARNSYFSEPSPNGFYTGDSTPVPSIGLLRDYYAWTWGDALFVVIDPYWHSAKPVDNVFGGGEKNRDWWDITLGEEQYKWFRQTLALSKEKYKFVFAHHVLGTGRGGIEEAGLYEWGGKDKRGADSFSQHRPGWEAPIHQLMAKYGVTIFFQGHDHVFAHQQLDGVVYQTLAEPADSTYTLYNRDAYNSGDVLPNSGRVRVTVSPSKVHVEYIRSYLPKDGSWGEAAFAYDVAERNAH